MKAVLKTIFVPGEIAKSTSIFVSKLGLVRGHFRWLLLPVVFLFLTLQLASIKPTEFTSVLPLVAAFGFMLCLFYKTRGLVASYVTLLLLLLYTYKGISVDESLWQMGIIFTLAVDFFIALLAIEKVEEESGSLHKRYEEKERELIEVKEHFVNEESKYHEYIDSLKETVQELTRDVEQRRIDKVVDQRHQELIQSEIALLTEQKQALINDAFEARAEAKENLIRFEQLLEGSAPEPVISEEQSRALEASKKTIDELQKELARLREKSEMQQLESRCDPVQDEASDKSVAEIEGRYKQLRVQFDEKATLLRNTRKELFETETKLLSLQREQASVSDLSVIEKELERQLILAAETQKQLEEEILLLEDL